MELTSVVDRYLDLIRGIRRHQDVMYAASVDFTKQASRDLRQAQLRYWNLVGGALESLEPLLEELEALPEQLHPPAHLAGPEVQLAAEWWLRAREFDQAVEKALQPMRMLLESLVAFPAWAAIQEEQVVFYDRLHAALQSLLQALGTLLHPHLPAAHPAP